MGEINTSDFGQCESCGEVLCLRKQVINLALGNEEQMYCLNCLAKSSDSTNVEVLEGIRDYILGRNCFAKEWKKYVDRSYCPCPQECVPDTCFGD